MRSYRVEVTQQYCIDRCSGSYCITNDLFVNLLGISIRRFCLFDRSLFCYRKFVRLSVNRTGRREYDSAYIMFRHQFEQIDQRYEVITIIKQRLLNRLTHRLAGCEMNNCFNTRIFSKHGIKAGKIKTIEFFKNRTYTGYLFNIVNDIGARV